MRYEVWVADAGTPALRCLPPDPRFAPRDPRWRFNSRFPTYEGAQRDVAWYRARGYTTILNRNTRKL